MNVKRVFTYSYNQQKMFSANICITHTHTLPKTQHRCVPSIIKLLPHNTRQKSTAYASKCIQPHVRSYAHVSRGNTHIHCVYTFHIRTPENYPPKNEQSTPFDVRMCVRVCALPKQRGCGRHMRLVGATSEPRARAHVRQRTWMKNADLRNRRTPHNGTHMYVSTSVRCIISPN